MLLTDEPIDLESAETISSRWIEEAADNYTAFRTTAQLQKDRVRCHYFAVITTAAINAYD